VSTKSPLALSDPENQSIEALPLMQVEWQALNGTFPVIGDC